MISYTLKPYTAFFSAQFRVMLQYRASALANVVTQFVFGFVHIMVFEAFYASSTKPMPIALPEVITYVWLTQATMQPLQPLDQWSCFGRYQAKDSVG